MKTLVILLIPLLWGICIVADETPQSDVKDDTEADEVTILFDGKTLKNWEETGFAGEGGAEVEEGHLVLYRGEPMTGINWTGPALPTMNYEITFDAQRAEGLDFFVCLTFPVNDSYCSLVMGGWGGATTGISSVDGVDASENETTGFYSFQEGRWYKVRLRVTETHLQAWMDEECIVNFDHSERELTTRIEVEESKPLGLCTYVTKGIYRNMKLRHLGSGAQPEPVKVEQ